MGENSKMTEEAAAIAIQRAFRKYSYQISNNFSFFKPRTRDEIDALIPENFSEFDITSNPPLPNSSAKIDPQVTKKYIESKGRGEQERLDLATKVVKAIRHISFDKFEKGLRVSIESFNEKMMSLPKQDRNYVLVLPGYFKNKSYSWVASLALKYLAVFPKAVVTTKMLEEHLEENKDKSYSWFDKLYQSIFSNAGVTNHFLFMDDASYSGEQLIGFFQDLLNVPGWNSNSNHLHIVLPFMSTRSMNVVNSYNNTFNFTLHKNQLIPPAIDGYFLNSSNWEALFTKGFLAGGNRPEKMTLTYFDHKRPDSLSCPINIFDGFLPVESDFDKNNYDPTKYWDMGDNQFFQYLVPQVFPPYK